MSIAKRPNGTWEARVRYKDGGVWRARTAAFTTMREAKRQERAWQAEPLASGKGHTLVSYLDWWLETAKRETVRNTVYLQYRWLIDRYLRGRVLGETLLDKLSTPEVQDHLAWVKGGAGGVRPLSASTVRKVRGLLVDALSYAVAAKIVAANVAAKTVPPRKDAKPVAAWTADQARRFLTHAHQHPYGPYFAVALACGLRRGELRALRWSDVDLAKSTLRVRVSVVERKGGRDEGPPKSRAGVRTITLSQSVRYYLDLQRFIMEVKREEAGDRWQENDLVFPSRVGTPLAVAWIYETFRTLCAQAGVPRIRQHDLRHTSASVALAMGAPLKAVSERLGHADVRTTMSIYVHADSDQAAQTANLIEQGMFSPEEE